MRRTLIQFDETTYRRLRREAFRQERSVSSLVRELVTRGLQGEGAHKRAPRLTQLSSIAVGRSRQGRLAPVSERHDEALAEIYGK
jgi:plasmid stability protein